LVFYIRPTLSVDLRKTSGNGGIIEGKMELVEEKSKENKKKTRKGTVHK